VNWEYHNEIWRPTKETAQARSSDGFLGEFVEWLNVHGAQGWEAMETSEARDGSSVWVLFKRPVGPELIVGTTEGVEDERGADGGGRAAIDSVDRTRVE